jgi:hypothetical protein
MDGKIFFQILEPRSSNRSIEKEITSGKKYSARNLKSAIMMVS